MSVPAPKLPGSLPETGPDPRVVRRSPVRRPVTGPKRPLAPARTTAVRPRTSTPPQYRRRARRGPHPAFLVFSAAMVIAMTVGVVALNAMLAQVAFAVHSGQAELADLTERREVLMKELATASAPDRLGEWARSQGMVSPDRVAILRVPGVIDPGRG